MHLKVVDARRFVKMPLSSLAGIFFVVLVTYSGLNVATCGVANATSFYSVATKFSCLVANLAPKQDR